MMVMSMSEMASLRLPAAATAFMVVMPWVAVPALAVLVGSGIKGGLGGRSRLPSSS